MSENNLLLVGPPGTGKTEFDLTMIEDWLTGGAGREQIAYVTFLKAAASDACKRFGIEADERRDLWFRTLHSTAYRLLGLDVSRCDEQALLLQVLDALGKKGDGVRPGTERQRLGSLGPRRSRKSERARGEGDEDKQGEERDVMPPPRPRSALHSSSSPEVLNFKTI